MAALILTLIPNIRGLQLRWERVQYPNKPSSGVAIHISRIYRRAVDEGAVLV